MRTSCFLAGESDRTSSHLLRARDRDVRPLSGLGWHTLAVKSKSLWPLVGITLLSLATVGVFSVAQSGDDKPPSQHDAVREAVKRGEVLPLPQVLDIAEQRLPGEVLEVELEHERGRLIYEIKVLTESGQIRKIKIDARSGDVQSIKDD